MRRAKSHGPEAVNNRPVKTLTKYATDFIATCTRCASMEAAIFCAAAMLAVAAARLIGAL